MYLMHLCDDIETIHVNSYVDLGVSIFTTLVHSFYHAKTRCLTMLDDVDTPPTTTPMARLGLNGTARPVTTGQARLAQRLRRDGDSTSGLLSGVFWRRVVMT